MPNTWFSDSPLASSCWSTLERLSRMSRANSGRRSFRLSMFRLESMGHPLPGLNGLMRYIVPPKARAIPALLFFRAQKDEMTAIFPIAATFQLWYISGIKHFRTIMKKRGGLKGLFNRFAAGAVLSAGILTGSAAAQ